MEIISQKAKAIMERCKAKSVEAGLSFGVSGILESLEFIASNRDMTDLSPKMMIPTLYDYWVHDVEVIKGRGKYELYPNNPYETVINTRPAISFYNENNPDWLNTMIFYHVLGHIDFFRNNIFFELTWGDDFCEQALIDKKTIERLREERGEEKRWVDYLIEFARGIDNIVGYYEELSSFYEKERSDGSGKIEYFFGTFLVDIAEVKQKIRMDLLERLNGFKRQFGEIPGEKIFFEDISKNYPEFNNLFARFIEKRKEKPKDLMQYILHNSSFLSKGKNEWMKDVIEIVRKTSLYFQPQIRTKVLNEGWASYWHQKLFESDPAMSRHEIGYSCINSGVISLPRVGINPYAIGFRLLEFIEELADKGKLGYEFEKLNDMEGREKFNLSTGKGLDFLFYVRTNFNDFMLINFLSEKNFQDFVDKNNLFVAGKRLNIQERKWQYYVKSRKGEDYRKMLINHLYHPPCINVDDESTKEGGVLCLIHEFEGKPLVREFIENTMLGIEKMWGAPVRLETNEIVGINDNMSEIMMRQLVGGEKLDEFEIGLVVYTMEEGVLSREEV